jgi:GMP synthase-like glutamine amidotransferase
MDHAASFAAPASHQDQVVELPPGAEVLAGSDFCPFGMLAYPESGAFSIQLHPEFEPAYAAALIENRRGTRFGDEQADAAIASLQAPDDRRRLGDWFNAFLAAP